MFEFSASAHNVDYLEQQGTVFMEMLLLIKVYFAYNNFHRDYIFQYPQRRLGILKNKGYII